MANKVKSALEDLAREKGSDWLGSMPVWLGNLSGVVETGTPGKYYARYGNSQVITVSNAAKVAPIFDLHVLVRRSRIQPNIWQITEILEDYDVPADGGAIASHHEQHEEDGFDRVTLDRKQIKQLSVRVSGTWTIQVYGATVPTVTGVVLINHQSIDLSSYVTTAGAKFVGIETNDSGTLSVHDGTLFGALDIATAADIPVPAPGKYLLAYVQFHEGQTALDEEDVRVVMPLPVIPTSSGYQISTAALDTPLNADLFGFWDVVDSALKAISWLNIKATLKTYFDTLYASIAAYITDAPSDGETYGRKNAAWVLATNEGHTHGLVRWTGAAGDTTLEFPDFVFRIESVSINGTETDPLLYSLSSDGSQLILASALSGGEIVTSGYILASL